MNKIDLMKKLPLFVQRKMKAPMLNLPTRQKAKEINNGIKLNLENLLLCAEHCGSCPSYPKVKGEGLYCASGKSASIIEAKGCNCMECPLFDQCSESALGYFCRDGVEPHDPKDTPEPNNVFGKIHSKNNAYLMRFTETLHTKEKINIPKKYQAIDYGQDAIELEFMNEKKINSDSSQSILRAALDKGIAHTNVCGGRGKCSTCRILVTEGLENLYPRNEVETNMALKKGFPQNVRLACQAHAHGKIKLKRLVFDNSDIEEAIHAVNSHIQMPGSEIYAAILFSDIRSFTSFSEKNLPYDIVHILNRYFNAIGNPIDQEGGFIDKYMGDGIMAIFGLEKQGDRHPVESAVLAAKKMLEALKEFNLYLKEHFNETFSIGIGIHYGPVVVGNLGYHKKVEFTAIGDTVNLASRIESLNKKVGSHILISSDAKKEVKDLFEWSHSYKTKVKGKENYIIVHRPTFG